MLAALSEAFDATDAWVLVASCCAFALFFASLAPHVPTEKGKSWLVMLLSSSVLSVFGVRACYIVEQSQAWSLGHVYGEDFVSRCVVLFFVASNIMDLVLGVLYYRNLLDPLTTLFHHTFYLAFMAVLLSHHYARGFTLCFFMEIPTVILAAGSVNHDLRSDAGFGITFLLCRLLFNVYLAYRLYLLSPEGYIWRVCVGVLLFHCYWFYTWYAKQGRKLLASWTSSSSSSSSRGKKQS